MRASMGKIALQEEQSQIEEAVRLKILAEKKFYSSNLKSALKYARRAHRLCPAVDGVAEMLTAFRVLRAAAAAPPDADPDWYKILDLEPFCNISSIKKQYKKLALVLHPDKNTLEASGEAFKLVNDAVQVLSDRVKRKEYDMKLRVAMQGAAATEQSDGVATDTFWTKCSRCRLFHKFDRKYIGHSLVCPGCRKSFKAVEVSTDEERGCFRGNSRTRENSEIVDEKTDFGVKRKMSNVDEVLQRSDQKSNSVIGNRNSKTRDGRLKVAEPLDTRKGTAGKEMTLAEIRVELRRKTEGNKKAKIREENEEKEERALILRNGDMEVMAVEDSDFYDFDGDRVEKSFKQGQVWAIYDDDDGMPRHYGLIEEVVSVNPFEVKMSWLDLQNDDQRLISWEKMGFHVSCGRFKVSRKDEINLVNVFSHMVKCERVARELYRIYPHKGSVWALYDEEELEMEGRNSSTRDNRHYNIVVLLTSYSEMYGMSMAYLEKVDGYRTVFKRREIGHHAVRWLEKYDFRWFSHQIPARKLFGDDVPDHLKDCWELDPAALPLDLLKVKALQ